MKVIFLMMIISTAFSNDIIKPEFAAEVSSLTKKFNIKDISVKDLSERLKKVTNIKILDIRESAEFKVSHLPSALNAAYNDFEYDDIKNKINKSDLVITYCSVGYRSSDIGDKLLKKGYNVLNLKGGIFEWVNQGHAVFKDNIETNKVHTYNKKWAKWLDKGEKVY